MKKNSLEMLEILSVYFELRNVKKDSNIFKTQSVYQKPSKNQAKIFKQKNYLIVNV